MLLAQQAWDFVLFRWDRYVLTFGLYDQLQIFGSLRELWSDFWSHFKREEKPEKPRPPRRASTRSAPGSPSPAAAGACPMSRCRWRIGAHAARRGRLGSLPAACGRR